MLIANLCLYICFIQHSVKSLIFSISFIGPFQNFYLQFIILQYAYRLKRHCCFVTLCKILLRSKLKSQNKFDESMGEIFAVALLDLFVLYIDRMPWSGFATTVRQVYGTRSCVRKERQKHAHLILRAASYCVG